MTREEIKKAIEVMQHFADGGEVEVIDHSDKNDKWQKTSCPVWNWAFENYRIKPQSMKVTEEEMEFIKAHTWIKFKSDGRIVYDIFKFAAPEMKKRFVNNFYVLNPDTMEWEDCNELELMEAAK